MTHIIAEGSAPLIVLYSFPWLRSVTLPAQNFTFRQVFMKLVQMTVGGFVWLLIFWEAMLVGSHDFLEILSGMALVMEKNSFPFLNKLLYLGPVYF